ncbi:MAG: hypothetical protein Q7S74_06240 [Nanoarchaeota archaeon]|nr:hypothetical protein [Nanoarchaeota archaeon]
MVNKFSFSRTVFFLAILLLFAIYNSTVIYAYTATNYSASNESLNAQKQINSAKDCFDEMSNRGLPVKRVNESLSDALQLYDGQQALESKGQKANYQLVLEYSQEVCQIKEKSFKADDELKVFLDEFSNTQKSTNLSSMQEDYDNILRSFQEERFEDTLNLIEKGYKRMSEIESTQTSAKLFYESTTRSIKSFFIDNWEEILITCAVAIFLLIFFWKSIRKVRVKLKLRNLALQKQTLNKLIQKLQDDYFMTKTLSETEYHIKLEKFKEMIRDIDRQIPLLKEEFMKLAAKDAVSGISKGKSKKRSKA